MSARRITTRRSTTVAALTAATVLGLAPAALAHVTVNPGTAEQGGFTKVSFRVPNERDDAGTTKLVVNLPADHPIAFVSVRPVPGWTVQVTKSKLKKPVQAEGSELTEAVTRITWSGGRIDPGQFQEFDVSLGPLPTDVKEIAFPAEQTYSGGEVVKWNEAQAPGQEEPEHPAPVLALTPKGTGDAEPAVLTATKDGGGGKADDGTARLLGGLGIAAGVVGIGVGAFGLSRARSARSGS
ncbi:YcnI family copper-binding membrane protein [Actinomadura parmotrematis]|uniref:YcnI family protein n=1 Tax=Actinomadura parmotrematis TaxID=2864039 RepID=A0ABS7FRL7_9ACTN|nr:YcnI family protein [Actinomadura parmotrematis]MBW8483047.1 YcnI family protein [Actinomadura parmotrematis]